MATRKGPSPTPRRSSTAAKQTKEPAPKRSKKERTLNDVIELLHRHGIRFPDEE